MSEPTQRSERQTWQDVSAARQQMREMISQLADLTSRIGIARMPEEIKARLEELLATWRRWELPSPPAPPSEPAATPPADECRRPSKTVPLGHGLSLFLVEGAGFSLVIDAGHEHQIPLDTPELTRWAEQTAAATPGDTCTVTCRTPDDGSAQPPADVTALIARVRELDAKEQSGNIRENDYICGLAMLLPRLANVAEAQAKRIKELEADNAAMRKSLDTFRRITREN